MKENNVGEKCWRVESEAGKGGKDEGIKEGKEEKGAGKGWKNRRKAM